MQGRADASFRSTSRRRRNPSARRPSGARTQCAFGIRVRPGANARSALRAHGNERRRRPYDSIRRNRSNAPARPNPDPTGIAPHAAIAAEISPAIPPARTTRGVRTSGLQSMTEEYS
jgi:hypothetical protein